MLELQNDYHIYAVDLRGFGQSDKPKQFVYTMAEQAADVIAFMDKKEIRDALVMGHSMGSMIAQNVAFSDPDRIRGVALLATFSHMHETQKAVREVQDFYNVLDIQGSTDEELLRNFIPDSESLQDQSFVQGYLSTLKGLTGSGLSAAWFGMSMADNRNFLQFIKAPVFIGWGSEDAIFTKAYQDELREYLPDAKYEDFVGIAHEIPTEIPKHAAEAVNGFFQSITNS